MNRRYRTIYEAFLAQAPLLAGPGVIVGLAFQGFCDPCRSTKPYVEALAWQYGFSLLEIDLENDLSAEFAGTLLPLVIVFRDGVALGEPLNGAKTKAAVAAFLREHGVIGEPA